MFKKGIKALKSIGKKSSKKKEKGDGDNVSEAANENLAASQGSLVKGASASSNAPVVLSEIGDGESAGDHGARPRSVGIPQPSPSAAGAARPVLTKQAIPVGQTRGTEEEDSVVAALQALMDQKVSQSQTSEVLVEESDEDDDEDESSSTESELTFKKKLKAEQNKEDRRKKGLSVSSSSSEESSWGDTSDILPSPESKQPLTKPQTLTQEQPKTAAQTVKRDGDESSASNWSDSETERDDSQLRPSTVVKAPVSPDVVSAAGSVWSDEGGGTITGVLSTSAVISQPPKPSADTDNQPEPIKSNPALAATEKDDVGSSKASAPPVGGSDIPTSKSKEHTDFLPSDSTWSDSDDDQASVAKPSADTAESQPITRTVSPQKSASDWSDDDLPSPAPVKPATEPEVAVAARPTLERQQSAESAWSDDDSIELAAAPTHSTALQSTFTKTEPELGETYNKGAELSSTYTKPPELDSTYTKPAELSSTFTKPTELSSTFTKPPELDSTDTKLSNLSSTFTTAVDADVSEPVIQPTAVSQVQTGSASQRAADEMNTNVANSDFQLKESLQEIQKLNADKQEMSEKLIACDLREAALTRTKEELESELAVLTGNRNKLKNTVEVLETKVKDLQVQNSKLAEAEGGMVKKAMYDDVTQKLKVIMDENQRLVADHQEAESKSSVEISRLREVVEEKDVIIQQHGKAEGEWQREKMELEEAVERWEGKYTQLDGSSRHQQQMNQQLESEVNEMREKLRVLESHKIELEIFKETSLREMEMLKGEMTDKDGYEMLQVEMEKARTEYADRLAKRDTKIEEMTRVHEQDLRRVKDEHQQELDELKRNVQRGEARQEALNSKINLLQSQNKELQAKNSRLRTEQSEKNKGLVSMREYEELQRDHDLLQKKVVDLQQATAGLRAEQAPSERNFQFSASSSDDDEDARHRMYNGNSSIVLNNAQQKELERQEDKIKQLKREISDLRQVIDDLQAEKRSVSSQLQDKKDEADDLKVQKEKLLEKLKIRDQEVTMELSKKLEGELVADAERSKLRQDTVLLESNVSRLTEANEQLKRRLASVTAELEVKREGGGVSANVGVSDTELVQLRTELAQLRSNGDAERATFMAAIEEKDREVAVETAEKESAKAALDEVTKSLMYLQDDMNTNYIPLANHREALARTSDQDERAGKELSALREKLDMYSKEALEAKNVCSMQQILINEKDRELRDKEKESRNLRRELDGKVEALSNANAQLQQASRERDRDHDRLREEMLSMSYRHGSPTHESLNYKTMYDELRIDKEREKATLDQLIERLKWENSTLEERLQTAKVELQDKVKLETNFLLTQGEADRYKQETAELMRKSTKLEERVEHLQREADHLKDSRIEAGSTNQMLREENSRLREDNVLLRSQLDSLQKDLSGYSVTKEEMEAAMATAKLTTDVNDMTRQESQNEVQLERKHKMVLYKQAKSLRTEINEKNIRLQELEKMADKLKGKVIKLKAENNALQARLREQTVAGSKAAWDAETGLTQADMLQQEVRQLQSQLTATVNDAQSQARKAKARKYDLEHQQSRADHLQKLNEHLSRKLDESSLMVQAAERTASDLRSHISDLNNRLQRHEQHESSEMSMNELWESQKKENMELEKEVRQLKKRLSVAETGHLPDSNRSRSRSVSPASPHRRSRTTGSYTGQPMTEYEKDRRALTRAAWAVLDDHGLGPPAEQRVFENLDRIWRRNASRPARYL